MKNGSIVAIAPFYSHEEYCSFNTKGKYPYILDIIKVATLQLSEEYGWDKAVFEKAYKDILESDFEFKIIYPPKMSRDKKKLFQVVIEKTETMTVLNLLFTIGMKQNDKTFENRNWFWYYIAYKLAKNSKWLDDNSFGVSLKSNQKFGYYSLPDEVIIGELNFNENDFAF